MTKEQEIMSFLSERVFDPIRMAPNAPDSLKNGVLRTRERMSKMTAHQMREYYWRLVQGTDKGDGFANRMRKDGFTRFEDITEEFRTRFTDTWLNS